MNSVILIGKNTFREVIRDRVLYGLVIFAIILIIVSLALGQLSFSEQERITINFGLTGIHLSTAILAIFVGSTLVTKEIDKKTILTLLVRPISKFEFILGKWIGLSWIIALVIFGLAVVISSIFWLKGMEIKNVFYLSLWGVMLESMVLLSVSLFFSSFTRPILVVSYSVGIYLIGHWTDSLRFFADKSESVAFKSMAVAVEYGLPNLEKFNWRALSLYGDSLDSLLVAQTTFYAFFWVAIGLILTQIVFWRKDFG